MQLRFNWAALTLIVTILLGIPAWLVYFKTTNSEVVSIGTSSEWFIPEAITGQALNTLYIGSPNASSTNYFKNVRGHLVISVKNTGDASAEDVRVNFPYSGQFSNDAGKTLQVFERQIVVGELRPKEERIISIWTFIPEEEAKSGVYVNHKNGSTEVDFGVHSYGIWAGVIKMLQQFWIVFAILLVFLVALFYADYHQKKASARDASLR